MGKNPYGRRGSPAHQNRILQVRQRFKMHGWLTLAGGPLPERKYENYFPDLVMRKGDSIIAIQVGRTTQRSLPVASERRVIDGLKATGKFNHVFFLKY